MRAQKSLAVMFVIIAAICIRLGIWQVDRLGERRAANVVSAARRALPEVTLEAGTPTTDSALIERRVLATGRYDYEHEIILRNHVLDGVPGVQSVAPLLLEGTDTAVLVNRGFIPAADAMTVPELDSFRERGRVNVEGIALQIESAAGKPIARNGSTTWGRLELAALRDSLPYPIRDIYLRRSPDSASARSFPRPLRLPPLDDGPHLSYALQWFAFATVALIFAGIVWWKRR